eukprot:TRINITY_DN6240_c0_g1_i1.p1 TRINITY_DN6240_c0_g1~~TRINITY_DN6240_c0_g1_i1.p1  ORF type:complete len:383 (+),score=54.46 TRINITY_DN6240_c0_g1_i1:71-1219(+)
MLPPTPNIPSNVWPPKMGRGSFWKGIFLAICFLISAFFGICLTHFPGLILIQPFSKNFWRYYRDFWAKTWFHWFIFCMEKINGVRFIVTGDEVPKNEFAFAFSNHPSEADWLFYFNVANRFHDAGHTKVVLKDVLRKVPGVGWAVDNMEFTFLGRNWKRDKPQIVHTCKSYLTHPYNLLILIFPEGTDFSPAKRERGLKYAQEQNIQPFKNLLVPRVKGFASIAHNVRPRLDAVYDFTIAYDNGDITPTLWSAWTGWYPRVVNIDVRRIPAKEVPEDKVALKQFLIDSFTRKDKLLDHFKQHHKFPDTRRVPFGSPRDVNFWAAFWFVFLTVLVYFAVVVRPYWYWALLISGWTFFFLTSVSTTFRRWRRIAPAADAFTKQK